MKTIGKGQKSPSIQKVKAAVDSSLKKYKKTYQLLDRYDKSPQDAPKYQTELGTLRKTLHLVCE